MKKQIITCLNVDDIVRGIKGVFKEIIGNDQKIIIKWSKEPYSRLLYLYESTGYRITKDSFEFMGVLHFKGNKQGLFSVDIKT